MPTDFDPTASWPASRPPPSSMPTNSDFVRLEARVMARMDRSDERVEEHFRELTAALRQLIVVSERQAHAAVLHEELRTRVAAIESKTSETRAKLDAWIAYGIGAWALASAGLALYKVVAA
jgi:hypothetical protein